jgi:hypothetical protein
MPFCYKLSADLFVYPPEICLWGSLFSFALNLFEFWVGGNSSFKQQTLHEL